VWRNHDPGTRECAAAGRKPAGRKSTAAGKPNDSRRAEYLSSMWDGGTPGRGVL